jgi:hypothetical protein
MIVDKRPHHRWEYFLLLDYPNAHDRERYWQALEAASYRARATAGSASAGWSASTAPTSRGSTGGTSTGRSAASRSRTATSRIWRRWCRSGTLVLIED